ncbi:MAG: 5'-3' exonuclease H3TH domain-containing protein [Limisphaerales bacterium]
MSFMPDHSSTESPAAERLLIVDGHAYAYRAFYAIRSLSSPAGTATNAIYGFIRMLGKMLSKVKPSHAIVVWDGGLAPERMKLLPEYKAQRPSMPADLESQLDEIVAYLGAANIQSYMQESCEADDCIAALAHQATAAGWEVIIASSDKDFMQLVSPQVRLLNPNDKSETLWSADEVRAKSGVEPTQIVDWLSLTGDSVDNIPGVPGVGAKTAANLLHKFGSVDELYRRLAEVEPVRLRSALQDSQDLVRRNQALVRLNCQAPCLLSLEVLSMKESNDEALRDLFVRWGFKTLLRELEEGRLGPRELFEVKTGAA